jgi:hypothetical protein
MSSTFNRHSSSYRDPSGFIFEKDGIIYRQVNIFFKEHFDHFTESGFYQNLVEKGLIIPHEQVTGNLTGDKNHYATLKPEHIPFISYPYEWSFDMLKDAALLTLQLVKEALSYEMILKDATPYNVQWHKGSLVFIDSLSFEKYQETTWIAYRQFCECFLGPLLLMHYSKQPLHLLQLAWPDGIPLHVIKTLLPTISRFSLHTYLHIFLHDRIALKKTGHNGTEHKFPKPKLLNLITSLESLVKKLRLPEAASTWSGYYEEAGQRGDYVQEKKKIIKEWVDQLADVKTAIDVGTNKGEFAKLLASKNILTIAGDFDANCINDLYNSCKENKEKNILPVIMDAAHPGPAIGVNNKERDSFINRVNTDLVMALALIHHLVIGKNIPFGKVAELLAQLGKYLVIEFVPKQDEKTQRLLRPKKDIYTNYSQEEFIEQFSILYTIIGQKEIAAHGRFLFLMVKKN